jgi:integrase
MTAAKIAAAKLTAAAINAMRPHPKRYEVHDRGCPGLYVVVFPSGRKSFVVRYRSHGLSRKLSLGPFVEQETQEAIALDAPLSLSAARMKATAALHRAKAGFDPAGEKREKKQAERVQDSNSLAVVVETFLELQQREAPLRSIDQRRADLKLLCEKFGRRPVDSITKEQFVIQLDAISIERGPVRANRVQKALKRLLAWYAGRRSGYRSVADNMEARISVAERARTRVLSDDELRRVWTTAESYPHKQFGAYVKFLLLTCARRNEAAGLNRFSELHDGDTNWIIPWQRYKTSRKTKHDVLIPLSKAAQAILAAQPAGEYPFGFKCARPLTNSAVRKAEFDEACGVTGWTLHDLRRTARTLMSRKGTSIDADTAERCLGHVIGGVRRHYDLHQYAEQKLDAFEALAALIDRIVHPPTAEVADIAEARSKRRR